MATLPIGPHRVEEMLKYCLELARKMLEANGAFFPFGMILDSAGERRPVMAEPGENKTTADAYHLIQQNLLLGFEKGEIIAGAIIAMAGLPKEFKAEFSDAVRITVESSTISRLIFLPYEVTEPAKSPKAAASARSIKYGELLGINVKPTIFART